MKLAEEKLTGEAIAVFIEQLNTCLNESGVERRTALRLTLAAEELFLNYRAVLGEETPISMFHEKSLGVFRIIFRISGKRFDPFGDLSDEDRLMQDLLEHAGAAPAWNYLNGCNIITFTVEKKRRIPAWASVVIAVFSGAVLGLLARLLPDGVRTALCTDWIKPIETAIEDLLSWLASFLILFSIIREAQKIENVSLFNNIVWKIILRLLLTLMIAVLGAALILYFVFPPAKGSMQAFKASDIWNVIIGIIPANLIEAFWTSNTPQITFIAIISSIVLLRMGTKAGRITRVVDLLAELSQRLILAVTRFMPWIAFISVFRLNAEGSFAKVFDVGKFCLSMIVLCLLWLLIQMTLICVRHKVKPRILIKKLLPTFKSGLKTGEFSDTLEINQITCEQQLGIDRQLINVGIPLGQTVFMPSQAFYLLSGTLCMAQIFGISFQFSRYLLLVFSAYILSIATPPLGGSSIAAFALLFTQFGIPSDALTMILALDILLDRVNTASYLCSMQLELTGIASSIGRLNRQILRDDP